MTKTNKLGLVLLWVTGLLVLALPASISRQSALLALLGIYIFMTWIVLLLSLIFKEKS